MRPLVPVKMSGNTQFLAVCFLSCLFWASQAELWADGCQANTYLCDLGNNELCNANQGRCECQEGYFAVDSTCAKNGVTGNLCFEGTISSNGQCSCYYGYVRLTDNTCGKCMNDTQCNTERGVTKELSLCISDGYDAKCFKTCHFDSHCELAGQKCLEHFGNYVCMCPEGLYKHPDGSCSTDRNTLGFSATLRSFGLVQLLALSLCVAHV